MDGWIRQRLANHWQQNKKDVEGGSENGAAETLLLGAWTTAGVRIAAVDLPDQVVENLMHIDLLLGRSLSEGAVKLPGQVQSLLLAHHAFVLQVALVSHQNHGHIVGVLNSQNLLPQVHEVIEGRLGGDGIDENEALAILHVQVAHGRELLGAGGVQNFEHTLLAIHLHLLAIAVLNGRVILLDKDALHKLDGQRRFAHTAAAQHHNFVFSHLLIVSVSLVLFYR